MKMLKLIGFFFFFFFLVYGVLKLDEIPFALLLHRQVFPKNIN